MLDLAQQNLLREQYRQRHPWWRPATETYAALAQTYLAKDARLLDLGCGRGGLIEQLDHPAAQMTGVDPDWLSLVQHRLPGIDRLAAISDALPFAPEQFDLILASWLLEHLPQPEQTLREVRRVLKPGGVAAFVTPNGRHPAARLNRILGRLAGVQDLLVETLYGRSREDAFPTFYRANTPDALRRLARHVGLELITLEVIPDPTYLAFTPSLFRLACLLEDNLPESRHIHLVGVLKRPM
jgi:SAM-dependent methyltransferase